MRILAVRGCNLTSLDGPFAVAFDKDPLRRAGLFAITGPTGAGKSTILDALCLALFDRMPRLPDGQGVLLGPEGDPNAIRSTDVRAILRRGAGAGWAEVDFVGVDGAAYRARWEVRRARQRARGALQPQSLSLSSLDGAARFGDKKTSVLEEIERRLGLTFEQFRRAVLLAQGDFATFLKAPPKDRSALLELLTGTEIYSRLSMAAHERAGLERQALDSLEAQGGGIGVLSAEERAGLEVESADADRAVRDGVRALDEARATVAWHYRDRQLADAEREAAGLAATADQAWQAATARRGEAALLRRLQPLRPLLADHDRAVAEAAEAEAAAIRARTAWNAAQSLVEETDARHADVRGRFEQACRDQQAAEPDLARAADLDGRITALSAERQAAVQERTTAAARVTATQDALRKSEQALATARETVARLDEWLGTRAALEPVVAQWSRWEAVLARHAAATRTEGTAAEDATRHARTAATLAVEKTEAETALADAQAQLAVVDAALAALQAENLPALEAISRRRAAATEQRDRLVALATLADAAARLADARAATALEQDHRAAEAAREDAAAAGTAAILPLRQAALEEAEATLERFRLAQREDVESLRARLTAGEPCPVCGSEAHPWAEAGHPPLAAVSHEQAQRVAALKAEVAALLDTLATHRAAVQAAQARLDALAVRRAADAREAAAVNANWQEAAAAFGLPPEPDGMAVRAKRADIETLLATVAQDESRALDHRRRLDATQAERWAREEASARLGQKGEVLRRRLEEARHAETLAATLRDRATVERDAALGELAEPFAQEDGWREALAAAPDLFRAATAERVAAYQHQRGLQAEAQRAVAAAAADCAARIADQDGARQGEAAAGQRAEGLAERLAALQKERTPLLDGQPVAVRRDALADRRRQAEALVDQATVTRQDATARLSAAEREMETRGQSAQSGAAKAAAAAGALRQAATAAAVAVEEARQRLTPPESALVAEEKALAEIETARRETALLAAERHRLRAEHHATGPHAASAPGGTAAEADIMAERLAEALERDRLRLGTARGRLEADDGNRARLASLAAAIEAQRARYGVWATLAQLIGSASGQKMRNFAQSLSLDLLLTHANRHLEDLARRYRLERIAGADLEIQVVDREMGDERRGVHSLSGGELFLVSLALALGLSDMAAGTAGGIGTLFIDEGFGTLDPDSLDVALSCLEALQASGRQVGVISHVPAMVERIGAQIRVVPLGGGRSRVTVLAANPSLAPEPAGT